nr:transposase [Marinobacter halodurans]
MEVHSPQKNCQGALLQCSDILITPIGLTALALHTHSHSRRLAFHPHVHLVVPGGGLTGPHWQARTGHYLFNGRALATVFRAKFLTRMRKQGFALPDAMPRRWVAQCEQSGAVIRR